MSRIRKKTAKRVHHQLGDLVMRWPWERLKTPLSAYVLRFGVSHLMACSRADDAILRLEDWRFLGAFAQGENRPMAVRACRAMGQGRIAQTIRDSCDAWSSDLRSRDDVTLMRSVRKLTFIIGDKEAGLAIARATHDATKRLGGASQGDRTQLAEALGKMNLHEEALALLEANLEAVKGQPEKLSLNLRNLAAAHLRLATKTLYTAPTMELLGRLEALQETLSPESQEAAQEHILEVKASALFLRVLVVKDSPHLARIRERRIAEGKPVDTLSDGHALMVEAAKAQKALVDYRRGQRPQKAESFANALKNLATIQQKIGHPDVLATCREAITALVTLYGEGHRDVLDVHGTLHRKPELALEFYQRSLDVDLKTLREGDPKIAAHYDNLAKAHKALGHNDKALKAYKAALHIRKTTLGDAHRSVGKTCNSIALVLYKLGQHRESLAYYAPSLESQLSALGEGHASVGMTYSNIAMAHYKLGEFKQARSDFNKALSIQVDALGEAHSSVGNTCHFLGQTHTSLGELNEALTYFERALGIRKKTLGDAHRSVARAYTNVGQTRYQLADYAQALTDFERSLEVRLKVFGDAHPSTALGYYSLATCRLLGLHRSDARDAFSKCVAIWTKTDDWKHHAARLGLVLCDVLEGADIALTEGILDDLVQLLGPDHERVIKARENVQRVLDARAGP